MPLEGGLYEWARLAFGDGVGFVVAWNLWLYAVIYMALAGLARHERDRPSRRLRRIPG